MDKLSMISGTLNALAIGILAVACVTSWTHGWYGWVAIDIAFIVLNAGFLAVNPLWSHL